MKKIFLYTDTPIAGGAEKQMLLLAKYLRDFGNEVKIICSTFKSLDRWCNAIKKESTTDNPVIRLSAWHKHDPRQFFQLKKLLQKEKPDIFHIHLWNPGAGRYAFMASNKQKTKIVATEHDPFILKGIKKIFKKMALKKTNHTIAISHDNAKKMLQWYPEIKGKISVVHNGIDQDGFLSATDGKKEVFKSVGNGLKPFPTDFIITSVAALHPRKGLKYLIAAMPKVLKQKPNCKLVIAGEGPQKKELQILINRLGLERKIILLGHQDNVINILKASDIFVLPSIKEAFGLVLLEAMAAGIPIVASRVGGIPEIVENQKSGLLVESENSSALAEKIILLVNNKALRQKLASEGLKRVQQFDAKEMAKNTEMVYRKTLRDAMRN